MESKTQYRVGAAGLDPRDVRLIEIVFRHSQYNRHAFVLVPDPSPAAIDILIANPAATAGVDALAAARTCGRPLPAIVAVPRGTASAARHAISIDRLTLQLLPILNRVVEQELVSPQAALAAALAPAMLAVPGAPPPVERPSPLLRPASPDPALPSQAADPVPDSASLAAAFASTLAQESRLRAGAAGPVPAASRAAPPADDDDWPTTMTSAVASAMASMGAGFDVVPPASPPAATTSAPRPAPVAAGAAPAVPGGAMAAPVRALDPPTGDAPPVATPGTPADRRSPMPTPAPLAGRADAPAVPTAGAAPEPAAAGRAPPAPRGTPRNLVPFPAQAAAQPPRLKVLAVDDSPTVRRQLTYALDRMGLACVAEDCAEAALERLEREHVDLMLVDVELPDMDGYKLTRTIKRDRRFHRLPVVMLTSRASAFDLARGALAGCDSYLAKPVPLQTLEQTITRVLRKSLAIDDLGGLLPGHDGAADAGPGQDLSPSTVRRAAGPA